MSKFLCKALNFASAVVLTELVLVSMTLLPSNDQTTTAGIALKKAVAATTQNISYRYTNQSPLKLNRIAQITSATQLTDVKPSDDYFQALEALVERYGISVGYSDNTFKADQALTRYEFASYLNQALTNTKVRPNINPGGQGLAVSQLTDVQPTDTTFDALRSLVELYGLNLAFADGTFKGSQAITRSEFSDYVKQALGYTEVPTGDQAVTRGEFAVYLNQALNRR